MTQAFRRTGALKDLRSYPLWLQRVVASTERDKMRVVDHELFALMRDGLLPTSAMRKFLTGAWPTIEQFPQFMAMNLKKLSVGDSPGEDLARRYLIHNIRVEQKHAEHWVDWAEVGRPDARRPEAGRRHRRPRGAGPLVLVRLRPGEPAGGDRRDQLRGRRRDRRVVLRRLLQVDLRRLAAGGDPRPGHALAARCTPSTTTTIPGRRSRSSRPCSATRRAPAEIEAVRRAIRSTYVYFEMGLDHAAAGLLHGSFDETASNASTLGALDAA